MLTNRGRRDGFISRVCLLFGLYLFLQLGDLQSITWLIAAIPMDLISERFSRNFQVKGYLSPCELMMNVLVGKDTNPVS